MSCTCDSIARYFTTAPEGHVLHGSRGTLANVCSLGESSGHVFLIRNGLLGRGQINFRPKDRPTQSDTIYAETSITRDNFVLYIRKFRVGRSFRSIKIFIE